VSLGTAWSVLQVYPSTRPQAVVGLWLSNQRWKVKNTKKGSQLDWLYFVKLGQAYPESELVMCHIPITPFQLKNSTIPPNFISCQSNIYIYTYIYMYVTSNKSQYISYGIVIYNIICKYTYYIYMYVYIYIRSFGWLSRSVPGFLHLPCFLWSLSLGRFFRGFKLSAHGRCQVYWGTKQERNPKLSKGSAIKCG
jgi:hypothetical protein